MANIAVTLKQEVSRLSRKEIRERTRTLRRAIIWYRKVIARLKRDAATLRGVIARLEHQQTGLMSLRTSHAAADGVRFTAKGLRSHRARLGISAADYGRLIGVTGQTIYKWEQGAARPRNRQLTALVTLRRVGKREAVARLQELGAISRNGKRITR